MEEQEVDFDKLYGLLFGELTIEQDFSSQKDAEFFRVKFMRWKKSKDNEALLLGWFEIRPMFSFITKIHEDDTVTATMKFKERQHTYTIRIVDTE